MLEKMHKYCTWKIVPFGEYERVFFNKQHVLTGYLLNDHRGLRLAIATHCPSFSLRASRKTVNLEAKIAAEIVYSQTHYL